MGSLAVAVEPPVTEPVRDQVANEGEAVRREPPVHNHTGHLEPRARVGIAIEVNIYVVEGILDAEPPRERRLAGTRDARHKQVHRTRDLLHASKLQRSMSAESPLARTVDLHAFEYVTCAGLTKRISGGQKKPSEVNLTVALQGVNRRYSRMPADSGSGRPRIDSWIRVTWLRLHVPVPVTRIPS